MSIKSSDTFLDEIIVELQKMKEDPEKDTLARVLDRVASIIRTRFLQGGFPPSHR